MTIQPGTGPSANGDGTPAPQPVYSSVEESVTARLPADVPPPARRGVPVVRAVVAARRGDHPAHRAVAHLGSAPPPARYRDGHLAARPPGPPAPGPARQKPAGSRCAPKTSTSTPARPPPSTHRPAGGTSARARSRHRVTRAFPAAPRLRRNRRPPSPPARADDRRRQPGNSADTATPPTPSVGTRRGRSPRHLAAPAPRNRGPRRLHRRHRPGHRRGASETAAH